MHGCWPGRTIGDVLHDAPYEIAAAVTAVFFHFSCMLIQIDLLTLALDNSGMKSAYPTEVLADLQSAVEGLMKGIHDPEIQRQAAERMDRMREQLRLRHEVAVDIVRESRDE